MIVKYIETSPFDPFDPSHLTIRDLRIGVPQTRDDSVTLDEDTPTVIAALDNDLNALQPGFVPVIVDAPAHGQVTFSLDGSGQVGFTYAPDENYHGTDSFTYKLSDGHVDSNLATVSLSVLAVNDAPVATNTSLTLMHGDDIKAFGIRHKAAQPWLFANR